jgi:glutamate transport system substrate-binding protein
MNATASDSSLNRTFSPWRRGLTAVCVTVMLLLVGAAACTEQVAPKETVESVRTKSPTLRDKARLRIGVRDTVPFMGYRDPKTGVRSGFEVELATALARELGYTEDRIDWVSVASVSERLAALQSNKADLVLANLSMTKERDEFVDMAGPYFLVPQAVMVRGDRTKQLETIADLRASNVHVCTGTGTTSEKALIAKGITPDPVNTNDQCMAGLRSGKYDAYSTDLPILAGFLAAEKETFEILDIKIADFSERIGVALPNNDEALRGLVAYFLNRWQRGPEGSNPWLVAYDHTIGQHLDRQYRSQPLVDNPPELADYDSKAPRR